MAVSEPLLSLAVDETRETVGRCRRHLGAIGESQRLRAENSARGPRVKDHRGEEGSGSSISVGRSLSDEFSA